LKTSPVAGNLVAANLSATAALERPIVVARKKPPTRSKARAPSAVRKITVEVPAHDLASAQALTGKGVTDTVRAGLKHLASLRAQRAMLKLRGQVDLGLSIEDMKYDR
jgi:hypothetical protein